MFPVLVHSGFFVRFAFETELQLRAARVASFRNWVSQGYEELVQDTPLQGLRVVVNVFRADATKISMYKKSKLNVFEVSCTFLLSPLSNYGTDWRNALDSAKTKKCLGAICRVRSSEGLGSRF